MKSPCNLLYVEGNKTLAKIVTDFLQSEGIDARAAHNIDEALKTVRRPRPDVILLADLVNNEQGVIFLKRLQLWSGDWAKIPVIWLCSRVYPEQLEETLSHGGVSAIKKPFSLEQITESIKAYL